jgi:hypothetical protein
MPDKFGMCAEMVNGISNKKVHISKIADDFRKLAKDIASNSPWYTCEIYLCMKFGDIITARYKNDKSI